MQFRRTGAVFWLTILTAFLTLFAQMATGAASAFTLHISIKNHRFQSTELKVPANTPVILVVRNLDPTAEEFESNTLRVEKVVAGNSEITLNFRPLAPGRYRFYGDFNEATAQGAITAE